MADPITWIGLVSAAVGAGATMHTQKKAEDAREDANQICANERREAGRLAEVESEAASSREFAQANTREAANQAAEMETVGTMENVAEGEKMRLQQEKLLAAEQQQSEYASKFQPGSGAENTDTASDFLVPRVADDAGLVRTASDTGGAGLVTPLTFA